MPMRLPVPDFQTSEQSNPQAIVLGAGNVTTPSIVPTKAQGQSIVGLVLSVTATVTQSAAANWQVSELLRELKITKGSKVLANPQSFAQLQRLFNALTSLSDTTQPNTYFNNPTSAGAQGQTTQTLDVWLPLQFSTETPIVISVGFGGIAGVTNCTAASAIVRVTFLYSTMSVKDDIIKIVTAPAALAAGVDVDVSQYFSENELINEVWFDVTLDANLASQSFHLGSNVVYDAHNAFQLRAVTMNASWMQPIAGFFAALDMPIVYPTTGSTASKPKLILNVLAAVTPTFYLFQTA